MFSFLRNNKKECFSGIGVIVFVFLLLQSPIALIHGVADTFDRKIFDASSIEPRKDIVLVLLDDKTLNDPDFKRFQDISRADYAHILEQVMQGNPTGVGLDVFFYNESKYERDDRVLAEVLQTHQNIILASSFDRETMDFLPPTDVLGVPIVQTGYINLTSNSYSDTENITQIDFLGSSTRNRPFANRLQELKDGSLKKLRLENGGHMNIHFFGGPGSYESVSFIDVFRGNIPPSFFTDRIVLIGASATDIHDNYFTPTARLNAMPGVEIHAHALQTILDEAYISYHQPIQKWAWSLLGAVVLLATMLLLPWWGGLLVLVGLSAGYYWLAFELFRNGVVGSFFWPIFTLVLLYGVVSVVRFVSEQKQRSFLQQSFGRYVAPEVVKKLIQEPSTVVLKGEEKPLAIWFSDIVNFTNKSERLAAEKVVHLLNLYLERITPVIHQSGGTIDKFLGDGVMAFWGAPLPVQNSSLSACKAALQHQEVVQDVNDTLVKQGLPPIEVRIGLHFDFVRVGSIGTPDRLEYTALGDGVNLAARLEGINKAYGTNLLVSESVVEEAGSDIVVRELDTIRVKGKDLSITVFELLALKGKATEEQIIRKNAYEKGLLAYRNQDWDEARRWFSVHKQDPASGVMLNRIEVLEQEDLPKSWDGVFTFKTK